MDPHSFLYTDFSPYSFLFNNPINFQDPTGMDAFRVTDYMKNDRTQLAICPTCPNSLEYQPFIDDPNNVYHYDINSGSLSLIPMLEEVTVMADREDEDENEGVHSWNNLAREVVGGGAIWAGKNNIPVSGKTADATQGTSIASKYLSQKFPQYLSKTNPKLWKLLRKIIPKRVVGQPLRSPIAGRMMGRSVPLTGEILILCDAIDITYKAVDSFINDNPKEFWEQSRKNVTTIGMYHEEE